MWRDCYRYLYVTCPINFIWNTLKHGKNFLLVKTKARLKLRNSRVVTKISVNVTTWPIDGPTIRKSMFCSHQHYVEPNVAGQSSCNGRSCSMGKVEPQTWDSTNDILSFSSRQKVQKCVLAGVVYLWTRRGNNDVRHMGDSPGVHRELLTFLSFLFFSLFARCLGAPYAGQIL